jgi:hypothetical protein
MTFEYLVPASPIQSPAKNTIELGKRNPTIRFVRKNADR